MGLRGKVALWLALMIVPVSFAMAAWRVASEHRSIIERRADRFASRLERHGASRCERHPERWELRRRELVAFAYDTSLSSANPAAPPFPQPFVNELGSDEPVHHWFFPGGRFMGATLIRRAESGPCALVVVVWGRGDAPPFAVRRAIGQTAALAAILAVLGLLVTFPIVRRIRKLEEAVHRARHEPFTPDLGGNDEIDSLARAFDETFQAVRQREAALEEYIANTTHDLAIPLTVLQHRLKRLAEGPAGSEDARVALEESHYIASLIANMRTAAKLESPEGLDLGGDVNLTQIVERVVQRHAPIAAQKGVELNFAVPNEPLVVRGEPTLVEQALSNLVQNGVQYNTSGGHVSVLLEPTDDGGFELRVIDDGPGIPEALREQVLERGVRADSARTRNEGGQGFGLSIVSRVCRLHDWKLALVGEPGLTVVIAARR